MDSSVVIGLVVGLIFCGTVLLYQHADSKGRITPGLNRFLEWAFAAILTGIFLPPGVQLLLAANPTAAKVPLPVFLGQAGAVLSIGVPVAVFVIWLRSELEAARKAAGRTIYGSTLVMILATVALCVLSFIVQRRWLFQDLL